LVGKTIAKFVIHTQSAIFCPGDRALPEMNKLTEYGTLSIKGDYS
jgi:hypothetical protein